MTDTAKKIRALCCGIIEMIDYDDLVTQLPSCNDCAKKDCPHRPKLGDTVRINCFDWEGKEEDDAMS